MVLEHVRPVGVRSPPRPPGARRRGGDDLRQHRLVVPVHARLSIPLLGDRRRRLRGRDRRGDRVDLEPVDAAVGDAGVDGLDRARRGAGRERDAGLCPVFTPLSRRHVAPRGGSDGGDQGGGGQVGAGAGLGQRRVQHRHPHDPPGRDLRVPRAVVQHQLGSPGRAPGRSGEGAVPRARAQPHRRPPRQGAALGPSVQRVHDRVAGCQPGPRRAGGQASPPTGASARRSNRRRASATRARRSTASSPT